MGFSCGIVGLPNVGKSTLFNAITRAEVEASNYPFCTIEPNHGVVAVPDDRVDLLADFSKSQKKIFTTVDFTDIAGLVAGASHGEGLGNQFLSHIREVDAIIQVVRVFPDEDVVHDGPVSPLEDLDIINTELVLADLETCEKKIISYTKAVRAQNDKKAKEGLAIFENVKAHLESGALLNTFERTHQEFVSFLRDCHFLTIKPMMIAANVGEKQFDDLGQNAMYQSLKNYAENAGYPLVELSAKMELELAGLSPEDAAEYLEMTGLTESGLHRLIKAGYGLLGLITFFTTGEKETRAWTVRQGACAPEAAGVIHSDFEKGFIKAEVVSYEEFCKYKSFQGVKEAGKLRIEGKDYLVQDGDICVFRFNR